MSIDLTAPSGGNVSYIDGWTGASISISTADGTETGSGIDSSSRTIQRDSTAYSGGACAAFPGTWGTSVTSPDTSVANDTCYRYRFRVSDNAGNTATYTSASVAKADTNAPTTTIQCDAAACQAGYYTSSPVTVTLSANDGTGSGVQKIRYTTDGTDPTPVNGSDYVSALAINSTTTVKFRAYDNAGNQEAIGSQQIQLDATPPNISLTLTENPASGAQHVSGTTLYYRPGSGGGTFRVTAAADDPQTGVTSVDFPSIANVTGGSSQTSSPYREDYTWSASTTDAAAHNVVATNGAAATTSLPFTLTQDSAAPVGQSITLTGADAPYYGSASVSFTLGDGNDGSGSGLDTSSRTVTRESASLTGDSCGSFTADAGTYSSPDTSVSNGNCYRYSFAITDNVGNTSSSVTATAKVDSQAAECVAHRADRADGHGQPVLRRCDEDTVLPACRFGQLPAQRHRLR